MRFSDREISIQILKKAKLKYKAISRAWLRRGQLQFNI